MKRWCRLFILSNLILWGSLNTAFAKPVEIVMWHALAGSLGDELSRLVRLFNTSQDKYHLNLVYKGNYAETLTAFAAAYRVHAAPALIQVFEVGSSTMAHPKGVIKPVSQLLKEQDVSIDLDTLWPALSRYYMQNNELMALPLNVSLPIMYYDADKLSKLGYNEDNFPRTWNEFEVLLNQLKRKGEACAYTTAYPTWIHIEAFTALHGLMKNADNHHAYYSALSHHLKRLVAWQQQHIFEYAGRIDEATVLFTSGRCALFSQSSGAYQSLAEVVKFKVGVAPLPYDDTLVKKRASNLVGGGALWVVAGQSTPVEAGIAQFFKFMLQPHIQASWYKNTGYLPILRQEASTGLLTLVKSEWQAEVGPSVNMTQAQQRIRAMNDELIESLFAGLVSVKQMLTQLTRASDYAQSRFEKNHGVG